MPFRRLLPIALISSIALAAAGCSVTREAGGGALRVPVADHPPAVQARVAAELAAAPADAAWPRLIASYSQLRRAACAVTPDQPACRRICAADANRHRFCRTSGGP
jgi:hypothetical protein